MAERMKQEERARLGEEGGLYRDAAHRRKGERANRECVCKELAGRSRRVTGEGRAKYIEGHESEGEETKLTNRGARVQGVEGC